MLRVGLSAVMGAVGVLVVGAGDADADTVILMNAGFLAGVIDVPELLVATPGGEVRLTPREVRAVTLGPAAGDLVTLRSGRTISGRVDQAAYTVRLPRGQTLVLSRSAIDQLHFSPRP